VNGAASARSAASGQAQTCDGRHQTGLSRRLIADQNQLRQARDVLDTARLKLAQSVVDVLELAAEALQSSVSPEEGTLHTLRGCGFRNLFSFEISDLHIDHVIISSFL
jgi:hypothetical protein